jgi:ATP-dependent 26S proteasome regulatory subunit
VIDTPDRIVIMTSNHPEKLDPALVRPGRINRKLFLGNVKLAEAEAMVRHYFTAGQPLEADVSGRLAAAFVDDVLSPAQVESMCAEHDTEDAMIEALTVRLMASSSAGAAVMGRAGSLAAATSLSSHHHEGT